MQPLPAKLEPVETGDFPEHGVITMMEERGAEREEREQESHDHRTDGQCCRKLALPLFVHGNYARRRQRQHRNQPEILCNPGHPFNLLISSRLTVR